MINLYFYLRANGKWIQDSHFTWLLLNTDDNYTTGWIGFDYLVDLGENLLKTSINNTGQWQPQQNVTIINSENNELHFSISYQFLQIDSRQIQLQFKWFSADVLYTMDPLKFIDKGDAAPNDRFTYTYATESN